MLVIGNELYITQDGNNTGIFKVNLNDPPPATPTVVLSGLNSPRGLAQKGDYIYFSHSDTLSRFNWTVNNPAKEDIVVNGFNQPSGIAINGNDLYVTDVNYIVKIDLNSPSFPTTPTAVASLTSSGDLTIYGDTLLISTTTGNIYGIDMTISNPQPFAISTGGMSLPKGITVDGHMLFVADWGFNSILQIDLSQNYPVVPTLVKHESRPQDVILNGLDLIISLDGTDRVTRIPNPVAVAAYIAQNPESKIYTGYADSTEAPGFDNPLSWSPNGVPTTGWNLVVLPVYGYEITRSLDLNSLTVLDGAWLDIHNNVKVASLSQFGVNSTINWVAGTLSGNALLNNRGQVNCTTSNMTLSDSIVFANYGGFRFETAGDLYMNESTFHNTPVGEIKFDFPNTDIRQSNTLPPALIINEGIIRKTSGGTSVISVDIQNINGGIIQTEVGDIEISADHYNNTGIINVASGTNITWNYLSHITLTGVLTGTLDGTMKFARGDIIIPNVVTIDFMGARTPIELYGTTIKGGGVLNLLNDVSLIDAGFYYASLRDGTTLNNESKFSLVSENLGIYGSTFTNLPTGIIDMQDGSILRFQSTAEVINNYGLIKKSTTTGTQFISAKLNNKGGTIQVERGRLNLDNDRIFLDGGIYNIDSIDNILNFRNSVTCLGDLTGTANGTLLISQHSTIVDSATTATFDFGGAGGIDCAGCVISGKGTLVNKSKVTNTGLNMTLSGGLTLVNEGSITGNINITGGDLYNQSTGTLELQSNGSISSYNDDHTLYNTGLIKKSGSTGSATISVPLHNLDGRIQVERGRLIIQDVESRFIDGQYDVDSVGNDLYLDHSVTCQGTLSGQLNGPINWSEHIIVESAATAIFDFDGSGGINWTGGSLRGGGTLVNKSSINLMNNNELIQGTSLDNEGEFNFATPHHRLFFNDGIINNKATGVIDFQADGNSFGRNTSQPHVINNMGLIKKSASAGLSYVYVPVHNTGTIEIDSGTVRFTDTLYNYPNSIIKGTATIDLPDAAHYFHEGIYSPGASPGKLSVIGDFESSGSAVLDIELDGLTQESEYDLIAVQGAADVNGSINLSLGFDPSIGDTFTILTSSSALSSTLPSTIVATSPTNDVYTFDVQINTNTIVLEVLTDCQDNRVLNGVSVSGNYKAGLNITATNISVPSATVFSAPNVLLNADFTIPDGQIFEINQIGCD